MDSLTTGAAATVLERLYREAEAADAPLMAQFSTSATAEQMVASIIAAEGEDLHGLYRQHADHFLSVSPMLGRFLYMIGRACVAKRIVEFGRSMGVSTIHLAAA
jgi:predicted O-methyltransferase YrrM